MRILGACLANDVHVAGVTRFLSIAEQCGHRTHFTGPATDLETLIEVARKFDPELIGISYRLTPENLNPLLGELREMLAAAGLEGRRLAFAGPPPVVDVARRSGLFEAYFQGGEMASEVQRYLQAGAGMQEPDRVYPQQAIERIQWKAPYPLLRHHYGEPAPTIDPTLQGIERIAESGVLDVISLGADQDAQERFFAPDTQDPRSRGAGGVPFRTEDDLQRLYEASRRGNYPLMRSYSGTADHLRYADMLVRTIDNAWCATSLFWFNAMDGRGPSPLRRSLQEHMDLMRWHGERGIPVEGNEPYHWGMRDAPDVVVCAVSVIYAKVAKAMGVQDYIATYMFESPPHLSNRMDLAKCLAQIELAESFADDSFRVWHQTRTGLLSYPVDAVAARAHLAQSVMLQMAVQPNIVHIVGYTEADHAATADEVIESCRMAGQVIDTALRGIPDMTRDPLIQERKQELLEQTEVLLNAIRSLSPDSTDPFIDPEILSGAVSAGLLDAPQLVNNPFAKGAIRTRSVDGAILAVDDSGIPLGECERVERCLFRKDGI
ncbi:MAG: cobalamin B12-binding domain-containing protein [Anaerolineales bacterium]|nr:cobalamin B12-binding domain-containing protein [Anaerolineales bacterium]